MTKLKWFAFQKPLLSRLFRKGCGASGPEEERTVIGVTSDLEDINQGRGADNQGLNSSKSAAAAVAPDDNPMLGLAKRVESKSPWEVLPDVPRDTVIVFVLGIAGSGKSTQCKRLSQQLGYTHLSSGDLLREEVQRGTAIGKWAEKLMTEGKLVPNQVSITLLKRAILSAPHPVILLDGFPRSMEQVELVERGLCKCMGVLYFDVPKDIAKARIVPGKLRSDEFDKQFDTFEEETRPVVDLFTSVGVCNIFDATKDTGAVFEELKGIIEHLEQQNEEDMKNNPEQEQEEEEEDASYDPIIALEPALTTQ
ncbi:hypothetical protein CEUSTIGMA_g6438.t1 [Chlamydomonas eustigma]|uniref:adenylate kinase n=1 Tax=Chlamydomonas eustigma TaxID=1157962 RepID=A0A250X7E0_9CHLO|nr:hypothetical protein CEUSTIGMA_g6438.t1 [Chlamydomonas eustigma]|eukprot:GAX78998.1 hypothetical protein CEUSTIGMA_g6438.t1 [Chlamydomonas eustigma]